MLLHRVFRANPSEPGSCPSAQLDLMSHVNRDIRNFKSFREPKGCYLFREGGSYFLQQVSRPRSAALILLLDRIRQEIVLLLQLCNLVF